MRYQLTSIYCRRWPERPRTLSRGLSLATRYAVLCAIGLCVMATRIACAQPIESFSDHLLNRIASPTPAAYHVRTRQLIVGTQGDVRKIGASGNGSRGDTNQLHRSPGNAILRVRLDAQRERLWILDIGNVHVFDLTKNRLIRSVPLPNWFYAGHGTNCLPDLQLDPHGAAFVSDNIQPKLWRIDPDTFSVYERSVSLDSQLSLDVGFSGLAISEGGVMFAAMAAPGSLWRIDTDAYRAERIPLSTPIHGACAIETLGAVRSREFTLFVLAAGRASFEVRRIDMRPGASEAFVDTITPRPVAAPTSLLAWSGALYLASEDAAVSARQRGRMRKASLTMTPIFRID